MAEKNDWREYLRLATPLGIFVIGIFVASMDAKIGEVKAAIYQVDEKLFKHLTNDEIHTPKQAVISKEVFTMYQAMRDKEMKNINDSLCEIMGVLKTRK